MADYNRDPMLLDEPTKMRGRPIHALSASLQEVVRGFIRSANRNGRHVTLSDIRDFLDGNFMNEAFHIATLGRTLNRWGFEFGKGARSQHLKEKDHIIASRQRYLRKKRDNRLPGAKTLRPEVYLDESYVNKNHSNDFIWYYGEDGPWVQKSTGKGERLMRRRTLSAVGRKRRTGC